MYSREYISETISKMCDHFGLIAYQCFDIDSMIFKIKIEDRHRNLVDIIEIDTHSFNKGTLDNIWNKLSNYSTNEPAEKCEYCDGGNPLVTGKSNDQGIAIQYPNRIIAYGYDIHGSGSNGLVTRINYCPMCGKKLKGE